MYKAKPRSRWLRGENRRDGAKEQRTEAGQPTGGTFAPASRVLPVPLFLIIIAAKTPDIPSNKSLSIARRDVAVRMYARSTPLTLQGHGIGIDHHPNIGLTHGSGASSCRNDRPSLTRPPTLRPPVGTNKDPSVPVTHLLQLSRQLNIMHPLLDNDVVPRLRIVETKEQLGVSKQHCAAKPI